DRRSFLIAGDEEGNGAAVLRVLPNEFFTGREHRREAAFHVRSAAAVQQTILDNRFKGICAPFIQGSRGHDIGVSDKAEYRSAAAALGPKIIDGPKAQALDGE